MSEQMSEEAIERVAHAIMKAFADNGKTAALLSLMPQDARAAARAAIAALSHSTRPAGTEADISERAAKYCDDRAEWLLQCRDGLDHDRRAQRMALERASHEVRLAAEHIRALTPQTTGEKDKL